jgi:EamA domain-containing membrane protein RarD
VKRAASWLAARRKLAVAVAGAALTVALQVWGPGNPWVSLAVLAASSFGVYQVPNRP